MVADRSGVPVSTLNTYLRGRDMKAGALIALAEATGVRLEWLATGAGPMREGEAAPPPPAAPEAEPAPPQLLAHFVDLTDLVTCYVAARNAFAQRGVTQPEPRKLLALAIALYDGARQILDADAAATAAETPHTDA